MTKAIPVKIERNKQPITPENKCTFCHGAKCCTYVTEHIDTPRSMEDFDTLLWQVSHQNLQLYKDEGDWFLLINGSCTHLQPDGRCGIYEVRPQICREHSNEDCEFNQLAGEDDFDLLFKNYTSLDTYCRKRFKTWDKRFKRW